MVRYKLGNDLLVKLWSGVAMAMGACMVVSAEHESPPCVHIALCKRNGGVVEWLLWKRLSVWGWDG